MISSRHRFIDDIDDLEEAGRALLANKILCHAFGNFYGVVTRPSVENLRRVNRMKGRPPEQTGSVTTTRPHFEHLFDWDRLPPNVEKSGVLALIDDLFALGPFGFQGPAADHMPEHLVSRSAGIRTTQLIGPGYRCPSHRLMDWIEARCPDRYLYITSANRSRHQTGAVEEPAHFEAAALDEEFGLEPDFHLLRHRDEAAARAAFPRHEPMSTTIVAFHTLHEASRPGKPCLAVDRHGSLAIDDIRPIAARHGFAVELAPKAARRLTRRDFWRGGALQRASGLQEDTRSLAAV